MNNQNKMNWILIHQNKATKLRLQYIPVYQPGKMSSYGIQTKYWSLLHKASFLFNRFPQTKENLSAKWTHERHPCLPIIMEDFLPSRADSSHNFHELRCVLIGPKSIHYQFPHWEHRCLGATKGQGIFPLQPALPNLHCTNCFFNLPPNISSFTCCNGPEKATPKSWRWCMRPQAFEIMSKRQTIQTENENHTELLLWLGFWAESKFEWVIQGSRGRVQGVRTPEMTCGFLIQLVFCKKDVVYWCWSRARDTP